MTTQTNALLEAALGYAARGWQVFPCHTPWQGGCSCKQHHTCPDIGKHPRWHKDLQHGLKDATTDGALLTRWWTRWPKANIGLATGTISGLVVLDRDDYKGGGDSLEELERMYSPLPETVLSLTGGGGQHYLFGHPGTPVKNGVDTLGPGLDIRGDGGYIIAPPSLHKSGKHYVWEVLHEPDDTPLAPMPDWLQALCQETPRKARVEAGAFIPDHQRNDTLFRVGCGMRARGFTETVILAALREMNATQCEPPVLTEAELQKIVGSIAKYEAGPSTPDLHQRRNGDTPGSETAPSRHKETQVDTLLRLAAAAELLRTNDGPLYAYVPVNGHYEVLGLGERGGGLRKWLVKRYREEKASLPTPAALSQVVEALVAQAQFDGRLCEVYTRTAYVDDTLYLDLANERWEVVAIAADGWRVLEKSPVYFRRTSGMLPLPTPDKAGEAADLYTMLPVKPDTPEAHVLVGWLFGTLQPEGAHAHLALHGEQGSTKSTTSRMLRQTLDPNKAPTRSLPKEEKDLVLAASNGAIVGLENVSALPTWLSDALCCLSTGAGLGTRQLYTDSDEIIFAAKRPVILNGIAEVCVRGDLLDRTLVVMLPAMEPTARQREKALWTAFHTNHPKALGALLTAASAALNAREAVQPALPRMADFAVWVEAAAPHLGMAQGEFLALMQTNREDATAIELDATPLSAVLQAYASTNDIKEMSYKDALKVLSHVATAGGDKPLPKPWPRTPRGLSGDLRRLAPALRTQGWTVTFHVHTMHGSGITILPPVRPQRPPDGPPHDGQHDGHDGWENQPSWDNTNEINVYDGHDGHDGSLRADNFLDHEKDKQVGGEVEEKIYEKGKQPSLPSYRHHAIQNNEIPHDDAKNQPSCDRHATVMDRPPQPCPGCGKSTTWLIRGAQYVCSREPCGRAVPRAAAKE